MDDNGQIGKHHKDAAGIRKAARRLYGRKLSGREYCKRLESDLRTPQTTIRNWWFGYRPIPGVAKVAIRLLVRVSAGTASDNAAQSQRSDQAPQPAD